MIANTYSVSFNGSELADGEVWYYRKIF